MFLLLIFVTENTNFQVSNLFGSEIATPGIKREILLAEELLIESKKQLLLLSMKVKQIVVSEQFLQLITKVEGFYRLYQKFMLNIGN